MKYVTDIQLAERYGINRCTVWRWVRKGLLPKPIQISRGTTRWKLEEIEQFEVDRELGRTA